MARTSRWVWLVAAFLTLGSFSAWARELKPDPQRVSASDRKVALVIGNGAYGHVQPLEQPFRARPALSPDGRYVAFAYADPRRDDAIVLARTDGETTVVIETKYRAVAEPALGRQGERTLLAFTALPASGSEYRSLYFVDITDRL